MCHCKCSPDHPEIAEIIKMHKDHPGSLILVLQKVQKVIGYLPKEIIKQVAKGMNVSASKVYGVATFYSQFHLTARGQHSIRVCVGTACHVRGSVTILEKLENELKVQPGETTSDGKFTLETVACVGACGLAPVITIDDDTFGKMTPIELIDLLKKY